MAIIDGALGYRLLRRLAPAEPSHMSGDSYSGRSKLDVLLGTKALHDLPGKVVVDFGCGRGDEAIELARRGASHVYGIDIQDHWLAAARGAAANVDCTNVSFGSAVPEPADVIVSLDAFEHFADPAAILREMSSMLKPTGCVLASFGPTWYHPLGGHLFSIFPWAHLIFGEDALCRWRSHIREDGARKFSEVEGGLNQMSIAKFEHLVESSPLKFTWVETVPIRVARKLHNRLTREFLTAIVRCKMVLRGADRS